jgi:hypothetical protein
MNPVATITRMTRRMRESVESLELFFARVLASWSEPARIPLQMPAPVPVPRTPMRFHRALVMMALLAPLAALPAFAARVSDNVDGQLVDVQVLVDGWPTALYVRPQAWDKTYFQAFRGKNYSLVLRNQTNERVGVLISVDGLNVVNGQRSSLSNHESMYVLDPYESTTINGWRTSLNGVRRFVFVDEERSYASRTDQANGDMGWIRVLSFREQRPMVWRNPRPYIRDNDEWQNDSRRGELDGRKDQIEGSREPQGQNAPAPSMGGDLKAQRQVTPNHSAPQSDAVPGTGWGDSKWDPVRQTQFLAMNNPTDHLVLRYEYASGLRALGIFPRGRRVFERERGELGFSQPPRW